jgi:hypothetical protein
MCICRWEGKWKKTALQIAQKLAVSSPDAAAAAQHSEGDDILCIRYEFALWENAMILDIFGTV